MMFGSIASYYLYLLLKALPGVEGGCCRNVYGLMQWFLLCLCGCTVATVTPGFFVLTSQLSVPKFILVAFQATKYIFAWFVNNRA